MAAWMDERQKGRWERWKDGRRVNDWKEERTDGWAEGRM